jgi:hypothetical protein
MSENLPAKVPVRQTKELSPQRSIVSITASPELRAIEAATSLPSLRGVTVARRHLAQFIRFASRLTTRGATPAVRCCLFGADSVVATDLDIALRITLPGAREICVLVPVEGLKPCLTGANRSEVHVVHDDDPTRPLAVRVDGILLPGHDPAEFPPVPVLFPEGTPLARASFSTLEPVLVAASTDTQDRSKCGVFFELCKNVAVATNRHVLHAIKSRAAIAATSSSHGKLSS